MSEARTEHDIRLAETLSRIDATLPHLATKAELADLKTELRTEIASLRTELVRLELRLVLWLGGVVVAAAVALFAALRYWPPPHG